MAQNYIETFKNALSKYNPSLSDTRLNAIAWSGIDGSNILTPNEITINDNIYNYIKYNHEKNCP